MGALRADSQTETTVYLIETGKASPAVACYSRGVNRYEVEEARRKLGPEHQFDQAQGRYVVKAYWKRTVR